ncbi:MAG: LysR family transcriptional regulator [Oscillospiraceae bacterium]|nr:LysR family transcriptional regulator [Oscillospiraceae bacterium]
MSVNLEYYRTFYYAATLGSLGRAAEELCLTPPTVTKAIQALESQIGYQLFLRTPKGVRLTSAGEVLFSRVKPGLNLLLAGEEELKMMHSLEGGVIRIAVSEAVAYTFSMPQILGRFCEKYPKVRITMNHYSAAVAKEAINNSEIDFAIMSIPEGSRLDDFNLQQIYTSDNVPVVGRKYAKFASSEVTLRELNELPLIFVNVGYGVRRHYEHLYERAGLEFKPAIEVPSLDLQMKLVRYGRGYSFVPLPFLNNYEAAEDVLLLHLAEEVVYKRPVYLITHKALPLSRAAQVMIDLILASVDCFTSSPYNL